MKHATRIPRSSAGHHPHPRRGSTYVAVMGVALIATIVGFSALALARARLKGAQTDNDKREARLLAQSAVEQAIAVMNNDPAWRTAYTNNVETAQTAVGNGHLSFKLVDEDGNLADDPTDAVWIYGYGRIGDAVWVERARARIDGGKPLEGLRTTLYVRGTLELKNGTSITAIGGAVATDSVLHINDAGFVTGDAEARSLSGTGIVSGTTTVPADRKGVPIRTLFAEYQARATPIAYSGDIDRFVLGPGVNEYGGGVNPDGLYFLDTAGNDLTIKKMRLYGTLVIDAGSNRVTIQDECFMHPYRADYPTLIIKAGLVDLKLSSAAGGNTLQEALYGHNFNPAGAKYNGTADADTADVYPCEIRGLMHVIGRLEITERSVVRGCVIVDGNAYVSKNCNLIHDPELTLNPPLGYTADPSSTKMIIHAGSWSRQAAP